MNDQRAGLLTIGRWIRDRAVVTPERIAIDFLDTPATYAELDTRSERMAAALYQDGVRRGDRIATLTGNRPEHVEVLFACAKLGAILVPLNHRLAAPELVYQLDDAEPAVLFVHPDHDPAADAVVEQVAIAPQRRVLERTALDGLAGDARLPLDAEPAADDDPLLLVYTSGTTGRPKGALLTHANCFWTNLSFDRTADVTTTDVVLQVLPQFHVGGWNVQPLLAWWKGATVVLEPDYDPGRALDLIARKGVTTMMGVPATYLFAAERPEFATADLSSLRLAVVGGAPMPESVLRTWGERGVAIVQGYGLTEASPNVLCVPPEHAAAKLGHAGRPYPHVEIALRDPRDGSFVEGPGTGELCVRGPNVFAGYWRNPEATEATFDGGWLLTGDVAERDAEGFCRIRDRVKEMYISGGENVYPAEIESVLHDHPDVVEAAVIGVPDARWGEVGAAFVVTRTTKAGNAADTRNALQSWCRERLAGYKVPKTFHLIDRLPRSGMDKVAKNELRERFDQQGDPGETADGATATRDNGGVE